MTTRLDGIRARLEQAGVDALLISSEENRRYLSGFTGSAGFCVALTEEAGVFIDGRYRVQVKAQVAAEFTPVDWPETSLGVWIAARLPQGGRVGFDPWLLSVEQATRLRADLGAVELVPVANLVDRIWTDQPPPPAGRVFAQPEDLAGQSHGDKIAQLAAGLTRARACPSACPLTSARARLSVCLCAYIRLPARSPSSYYSSCVFIGRE